MHEPGPPLLLTRPLARNLDLALQLGVPEHAVVDAGHADGTRLRDHGRFGQEGDERACALLVECGWHGHALSRTVAADLCTRVLCGSGVVDASDLPRAAGQTGTAHEGVNAGAAWTQGKKLDNVRALVPMYETSFQVVALKSARIGSLNDLRDKRVGVGPAKGPTESFFVGLMDALGIPFTLVNGTPAELADELKAGRIDALWQGAPPPIPAIKEVADTADAVVFGMQDTEQQAMRAKFPFLALVTVPVQTYKGQTQAIQSVAAWNFLIAHQAFRAADAYWIARTLLGSSDPRASIHPSAGPTRAENAQNNSVRPFHPGALRYYRERGIAGVK